MSNRSIIRKQKIHFTYTGNEDAFIMNQKANELHTDAFSPAIEKALSRYDDMDNIICYDELVINITVDGNNDWMEAVRDQFEKQLKEMLEKNKDEGTKGIVIKKTSSAFFETLIYFLNYGVLPWNASAGNKEEFEMLFEEWAASITADEKKQMAATLQHLHAIKRMINIATNDSFEKILAIVFNNPGEEKAALFIASKITGQEAPGKNFSKELKELLLKIAASFNTMNIDSAAGEWIKQLENSKALFSEKDIEAIQASALKEILSKLENKDVNNAEMKYTDDIIAYKREKEIFAEGIYIKNAGVVIIAPFLPRLFENAGFCKDKKITDNAKALLLVHYCIYGNNDAAEFELLLPKILCGIDAEEPVDTLVTLSDGEMREADDMLLSVIEHWAVLKNTSVEGLRQSFLQRNGKLFFINDTWLLQVEQQAHDLLLQQLPWNISMIKLLWMKEMLRTEWIY